MKAILGGALAVGLLGGWGQAHAQPAGFKASPEGCERLSALLPSGDFTVGEAVAAGDFRPPGARQALKVPAMCRVSGKLTPTPDSEIKIEVWLPDNWNGRFQAVGNGGWAGSISYQALARAAQDGFAAAATNTGHDGDAQDGSFAYNHPEKLVDFAWRAVHLTTVKAKALIADYYGQGPRYSYWNGCSTGGRQGLYEAMRFPEDFDGILAGAPANNMIRLEAGSLWVGLANLRPDGSPKLTQADFGLLNRAALTQCDEQDGVKDGQIADPRTCRFKAASLQCKGGEAKGACLTPEQVAAADKIYGPARAKGGGLVYPGLQPGSETSWGAMALQPLGIAVSQYKYIVYKNPDWDYRTFDAARDVAAAEAVDRGLLGDTNPDLTAFAKRGGKLITYHGWADFLIAPENSINWYESVRTKMGGATTDGFYRLYMIPAMGHCAGAYSVDWMPIIQAWVEQGQAPNQVPARRLPPATGERPICVYPRVAKYNGAGSPDAPASFSCVAGPRGTRPGQSTVLKAPPKPARS